MRWLLAIPVIFALVVLGISMYLQPNDFLGCGKQPVEQTDCRAADAIVVVSGGDTTARTATGIQLWQEGWGKYLVVSGAAQDETGPSNATAMKRQAETAGIPVEAILVDEDAVNTQQNAQNTRRITKEHGLDTVILVTSGYHQRRASLEFHKQADGVTIRNYPLTSDKDWGWYWWLTPRGWWLAGGELTKIVGFYIGVSS